MYQHIDAKKLSFRFKAEGVLEDQKEGKYYKKDKVQTNLRKFFIDGNYKEPIIAPKIVMVVFTQKGTEICWQEVFTS